MPLTISDKSAATISKYLEHELDEPDIIMYTWTPAESIVCVHERVHV